MMKRFFELLFDARFFLLFQLAVAKIVPARWLRLGKSAYFRLARTKRSPVDEDATLEIRRGEESDVTDLVRDLYDGDESVRAFYEDFYRQGVQPWIATRNEKIVGVVWLYRGYYLSPWQGYDGFVLRLEIEPTARFVANVFVAPEWRRHGIFSKIVQRFLAVFPNETFYSSIDEDNTRSINAHEKIGFRRCGATYYVQLFGWTTAIFTAQRKMPRILRMPRGETVSVVLSRNEKRQCTPD